MAFPKMLMQQAVETSDLSGHWSYTFNTLGDQNGSATEKNKTCYTQITTPSLTLSTPCTPTIQNLIETLINKVQGFPIL